LDDQEKTFGLFAELGPLATPDAIAVSGYALTWVVLLPDSGAVTARLQEASRCLAFTVDVGPLPAEVPEAVRRGLLLGLLRLGYHWRESGTIAAALDGDGEVSLVYRHPVAELDMQRLTGIVDKLGRVRALAAQVLDDAAQVSAPPSPDAAAAPAGIPV
jgi:hypothetical protein